MAPITKTVKYDYQEARVFYDQLLAFRSKHSKDDNVFDSKELAEAKDYLVSRGIIDKSYRLNDASLNRFLLNFNLSLVDVEAKPLETFNSRTRTIPHVPCTEVVYRGIQLFFDSEKKDVAAVSIYEEIRYPNECDGELPM